MSDTTYISQIQAMLEKDFPEAKPLWNVSSDNRVDGDWLWATPIDVWGLQYDQFKQAVPGSGPLGLQTCTVADGPTQSCEPMDASMTAPGQEPSKLLIGHSDRFVDAIYDVMTSAEVLLDVTTLSSPNGRFLDSLKDALLYLSNKPDGKRPVVRILVSNAEKTSPSEFTADAFLRDITANLDPAKRLEVYVYVLRSSFLSWNHSKIVAADGVRALVGGHNQWGAHYLGKDPVFDLSMSLTGSAARHAQDYANNLWVFGQWTKTHYYAYVDLRRLPLLQCAYRPLDGNGPSQYQKGVLPDPSMYGQKTALFPGQAPGGSVPVLSIGRGGHTRSTFLFPTPMSYRFPYTEPSDEALVKFIGLAKHTIRMSIQAFRASIAGDYVKAVMGWNPKVVEAMAEALTRGVNIYVVMSNPGAVAGGLGPSAAPYDGNDPSTVNSKLISTLTDSLKVDKARAAALVKQYLHAACIRYSQESAYPDKATIPNHAKSLIVDDAAFYIGSQNLYVSNLAEFGYIVEDAGAAKAYLDRYWTPLWTWSSSTATTAGDDDAEASEDTEAMEFIMALRLDTLLNIQWSALMTQYTNADDAARPAIEDQMDQLISSAGFDTTVVPVLEALKMPFFTDTPPPTEPTAEALRFVRNLMNDPKLMEAFGQVVLAPANSGDAYNAAITKFLSDHGYSCTVLEAMTAFAALRNKVLQYWSGNYDTVLTNDAGASYANTTVAQPRAVADTDPVTEPGPPLVVDSQGVTFDGVAIVKYLYNDNTLTWKSSDGNATSASLRFGTVTRPTANDPFTGNECFGTVTYPDSGDSERHGVYSLYGRSPVAPPGPAPEGSAARSSFVLAFVFGALALTGLAVTLVACGVRAQRQRDRIAEEQGDRYAEYGDTPLTDLGRVSSPDGKIEYSVVQQDVLLDQTEIGREQVQDLTKYFEVMSSGDKVKVTNSAKTFVDKKKALENPESWELGDVVKNSSGPIGGAVQNVGDVGTTLMPKLSTESQVRMRRAIQDQANAKTAFEKLNKEEVNPEESMEFDYNWKPKED